MNDENERYSYTFETPVETQQVNHQSNADMKKFIRRAIAVCCAVCLIVGGGAGALVGSIVNKNKAANEDVASVSDEVKEETKEDISFFSEDKDEEITENKNTVSSNLLYTADSNAKELTTPEIVEKVENTVVAISVEVETTVSYYYQTYKQTTEASGSGVIVSPDGYIITNNHVVEDGLSYTVTLADGTSYDAKLIGADAETDLAVIKIEAKGLDYVECGDISDLQKGETAIVIGNPLGYLDGSVTSGIISAMDRTLEFSDGTTLYGLIQTDAAVNPGNSGGGLFNSKGQLIGIICAKSSATNVEGLGFAIPITTVYEVTQDLKDYGYVTGRPALGINTLTVNDYMTAMYYKLEYMGVYVQGYVDSTAQSKTELEIGDYIISIDDTEITSTTDIASVLANHEVGDVVSIIVYRDGEEITVKSELVERTADYYND